MPKIRKRVGSQCNMKTKVFTPTLCALMMCLMACERVNNPDTVPGVVARISDHAISVSSTQQVVFAPANLQYQASSDTWRFAEHQYDIIGEDNANIDASYEGWIDLFGWGTGNAPVKINPSTPAYATFVDWGTNVINTDTANTWRTLTADEWYHIFYGRTDAANLFGLGSVNEVNGLIILPDNWVTPNGINFVPSTLCGLESQNFSSSINQENKNTNKFFNNTKGDNYNHNVYTSSQWQQMENSGAVFLPAAGRRHALDVRDTGWYGIYWSSTERANLNTTEKYGAYDLYFNVYDVLPKGGDARSHGFSVRLVQDL